MKQSGAGVKIVSQVAGHGLVLGDIQDAKKWLKEHFIEWRDGATIN
ncbi:MAG: hypothetical protein JRN52_04210 [Nitrososphaerota archaeon]|nr:hypothetical protein [Nitrososphaerota archaeon]